MNSYIRRDYAITKSESSMHCQVAIFPVNLKLTIHDFQHSSNDHMFHGVAAQTQQDPEPAGKLDPIARKQVMRVTSVYQTVSGNLLFELS